MNLTVEIGWAGPWGVDFTPGGEAKFEAAFESVGENLGYVPLFNKVAGELELATAEQFNSQGASGGMPWRPLADSTIASRHKKLLRGLGRVEGQGGLLTLAGGPLERSFRRGEEGHVEGTSREADGTWWFIWGSNLHARKGKYSLPYIHHYGIGRVPARPILVWTEHLRERVVQLFRDFLAIYAREAGFGVEGEFNFPEAG